jgi:hypothetical protein
MLYHQLCQLLTFNQHDSPSDFLSEATGLRCEIRRGHEYTLGCLSSFETSSKATDFRFAHGIIKFVAFRLDINSIKTERVLVNNPIESVVTAFS